MNFEDPDEIRAYARDLAQRACEQFEKEIKETTPEQMIASLEEIAQRGDPEAWSDQDFIDKAHLAFVAEWLRARKPETSEPREMTTAERHLAEVDGFLSRLYLDGRMSTKEYRLYALERMTDARIALSEALNKLQ